MKISILTIILSIFAFISCTPTMKPVENAKPMENSPNSKLAEGKNIFTTSCAKCHDLPNPTEHSSEEWVGIMNAMAPKARLTDEQHQWVYDYIVSVK